jgi:hypothetical protein
MDFRTQVFVKDPEMYQRMFNEDEDEFLDEDNIENIVPTNEEELSSMMRQLRSEGIIS